MYGNIQMQKAAPMMKKSDMMSQNLYEGSRMNAKKFKK